MSKILLGLVCLVVFSEAMPQGKFRKIHIVGHPGQDVAVRDRTIIPSAPVLEDQKIVNIGAAPTVETVQSAQPRSVNRKKVGFDINSQFYSILICMIFQEDEAALFRKQAEEAKYSFESSIDDGINGHQHTRTEVRDGLKVVGMYSYSDGFFKRTVHYEADDKGYRITK